MVIVGNLLSMRKGSKGFKEYIIHKLNKLKGNALEFKKTPKNHIFKHVLNYITCFNNYNNYALVFKAI